MGLLTISEPASSKKSTRIKRAIGIDLGTTHSLVASYLDADKPSLLPDQSGHYLVPSIVYYGQSTPLVGWEAEPYLLTDAEQTVVSAKRFMGRSQQGIDARETAQLSQLYQLEAGLDHPMPTFQLKHTTVTPIDVSADILKALKLRSELILGEKVEDAVITVPAYFDDAQRQATKLAAQQAGLNVLRLLNEPTAAAVAYGFDQLNQDQCIAVYDLGGGTFDLSILQLHQGVFKVLATGGDTVLGGDDIDFVLASWLLKQQSLTLASLTRTERRSILLKAKSVKEALTEKASIKVSWNNDKEYVVTQALLDELTLPFIQKTLAICKKTLKDSGKKLSDLDQVVLVGGATRMPCIQKHVSDFFGTVLNTEIDPDHVVALGASIQANTLVGNVSEKEALLLLDVVPLSLGLETVGGLMEKIIHRNTTLPAISVQSFTTYQSGQNGMMIHILQGERELVADNHTLATFHLTGIPPMEAGLARIEVTFQVDADGLLSVTAQEATTGIKAQVEVKPLYGMEQKEILNRLKASYVHAESDKIQRELCEKQVESKQLIMALNQALPETDQHELTKEMYSAISRLEKALETSSDINLLNESFSELNKLAESYFSERANQSLHSWLAGRSIDGLERITND